MAKKEAVELIKVKSTYPKKKDGGSIIALSEYNSKHPNGHGFVASPEKWVNVAPTKKVRQLISEGILVEFDPSEDEDPDAGAAEDEAQAANTGNQEAAELLGGSDGAGEGNQEGDGEKEIALQLGDTPETLAARYNRTELFQLAKNLNVSVPQNTSNADLPAKILEGVK